MKSLSRIAAELQGYDPDALSAEAVRAFLSRLAVPVTETVEKPLFDALGLVLAEDVVSAIDVPPHHNSAMDGYAFDGSALSAGAALLLEVVGTALAGKPWHGRVGPGQCVKIMTGAIMPEGTDTVVPHELVTGAGSDSAGGAHVEVAAATVHQHSNLRLRGEDLCRGKPALFKGDLLTPARLGLAASLGLATLKTWRPLRVAYFSTGDEILSLGEAPREGAVYDSNRYTVIAMLRKLGCDVIDLGVVRDDPALLETAFKNAAAQADVIITSGGVSNGDADFTRGMMMRLGDVAFWRIAMRPGRPMAVGHIKGGERDHSAVLFGLPGNPVAVMVTFLAFVRPALLQMMGATAVDTPMLQARSSEAIRKKPGRTEYQRGWVSTAADGTLSVKTTGAQGSGVLRSMAEANGLIVLAHEKGDVAVGDQLDVLMFDGLM